MWKLTFCITSLFFTKLLDTGTLFKDLKYKYFFSSLNDRTIYKAVCLAKFTTGAGHSGYTWLFPPSRYNLHNYQESSLHKE